MCSKVKMKKITIGKISKDFGKSAGSIEATGTIGTFGPPKAIETLADDHETQEMKTVMGISGFGKKAKSFDIQVSELFEFMFITCYSKLQGPHN